jgi:hypothetical protein
MGNPHFRGDLPAILAPPADIRRAVLIFFIPALAILRGPLCLRTILPPDSLAGVPKSS